MSTVAAIGATHEMEGFVLAGVQLHPAETEPEVAAAWNELDADVGLVILSSAAAETLAEQLTARSDVLTVVMP